ncbi:MAG: c-type cytochrome [Planctomycetes bacterium]|nr:c-type cytochrome [Planctomycetota bacterium]
MVKEWTVEELLADLSEVDEVRNFAQGKKMFAEAACIGCHRVGSDGNAVGPDLTSVASRFSRPDILEAIVSPSKVIAENYQSDIIRTTSGQVITGRIVQGGDYRSPVLRISTDPLDQSKTVLVPKTDVESHSKSRVSRMPEGLLNTFSKEEILDLLAYLQSAGNARHPLFSKVKE